MTQQVLSFTIDKKKYVSNIFDFECFCMVSEEHLGAKNNSIFTCTKKAIYRMFEGTDATEDVLDNLPAKTMVGFCRKVWEWYSEILEDSGKNE